MIEKKKPIVIFFDDVETIDGEIAKGLDVSFNLDIVKPPPLDKLIGLYYANGKLPSCFLTDYRLSTGKLSNGTNIYYSGVMLLFALREALEKSAPKSGIPLIAISQYHYFTKDEELEDIKKIRELADYIIYKEDYLNNPLSTNRKILSIISDLPTLYNLDRKKKSWDALVSLLKPPDFKYVYELLLNSNPPLSVHQIPLDERLEPYEKSDEEISGIPSHTAKASWTSREASKWIIFTLLEYPGVLLDSLHASTYLGIDHASFDKSEWIAEVFKDARYSGVFHEVENFWWKYKFQQIASNIMIDKKQDEPTAENFINACPKEANLVQNKCIYSGEPGANKVCFFLKLPVRQEYALKYMVDDRPITMDAAFVSRTAYETSDEINDELLFPSAKRKLGEWYKSD